MPRAIQLSCRFGAQTQTHLPTMAFPRLHCRPLSYPSLLQKVLQEPTAWAHLFLPLKKRNVLLGRLSSVGDRAVFDAVSFQPWCLSGDLHFASRL